jgi:glycosyltransferase involved in cell wall biosynthesis
MNEINKVALYCDRPPRGGIGNYSRELHKNLRRLIDADLGFYYKEDDIKIRLGRLEYPLIISDDTSPMFEAEEEKYFALNENQLLEADLHHGTDATLSRIVPNVSKSVITVHDITDSGKIEVTGTPNYRFLNDKELEFLKDADRIILDSFDAKNRALKTGIDEEKMRVVYLGVNENVFKPYEENLEDLRKELEKEIPELKKIKDKKIFLNVSIEEPRKNVPHVLKAFGLLRKSNQEASLVRIGYPGVPQKPETVSLIRELEIEDDVLYLNNISIDQIAKLYNVSISHILPTEREGFCLAFAESLRSACPVIAYKKTTAPEVVGPGGILVDYNPLEGGNIDGLAEALSTLLTNKKLREEKIKSGLEHVKQFTWTKSAENTLNVYKEIL